MLRIILTDKMVYKNDINNDYNYGEKGHGLSQINSTRRNLNLKIISSENRTFQFSQIVEYEWY